MVVSLVFSLWALLAQSREVDQIRALAPRFVSRWSESDGAGLAGLFTRDGDLIVPTGKTLSGQQSIAAFYEAIFKNGYQGTSVDFALEGVRMRDEGFAVLDGSFSILKKAGPAEQGRFCAILVKESGGWKILALREMVPLS
jgi:uncharacterized protein (TIGR02246 family)